MTVEVGQYRMCRYVRRVYKVVEILSPNKIFILYVGNISRGSDRELPFTERMISQDRVATELEVALA